MYLKELTINGFKSFAKKGELEFSTSIAAIVGPNGSGKSNVAESFRFVLGEQSVKSMRGKRGEDLIWGGSDAVARGNRASVEVVFDNASRAIDLDFDEVRLERVVHRDGQNEYKINGSTVRLKDIHELLASAHIGATGHHIISQGEADRVISAGVKERREMIEDALGLKVYQLKKQEAEKKLKKTEDNIGQTQSLRREAAPHLKYLKKQVERAERSLQVQEELKNAYAQYLKREDTYVARRTDKLQLDRRTPAQQLTDVTAMIGSLQQQIDSAQQNQDTSAVDAAEESLRTKRQSLREAERALGSLQGQVQFLERRIQAASQKTVSDEVVLSRSTLQSLLQNITSISTDVTEENDVQQITASLRAAVTKLQEFLDTQAVAAPEASETDQAELVSLQQELSAALQTVETAREAEAKAQEAVTAARQEVANQNNQHHEAERTLFQKLGEERELRQTLQTIDTELQVLERDRSEFKQELQEAVTLIGRGAMEYFSFAVTDATGGVLTEDDIALESRDAQLTRRRDLEKLKIRLEELGVGDQ